MIDFVGLHKYHNLCSHTYRTGKYMQLNEKSLEFKAFLTPFNMAQNFSSNSETFHLLVHWN